jgi:hypothetical protein
VCQLSRRSSKLFNFLEKRYIEGVTAVQQSTRVADSSMCIEHIINPVLH